MTGDWSEVETTTIDRARPSTPSESSRNSPTSRPRSPTRSHNRHIGLGIPGHHPDQCALSHAGTSENSHALSSAYGQQAIDDTNSRAQSGCGSAHDRAVNELSYREASGLSPRGKETGLVDWVARRIEHASHQRLADFDLRMHSQRRNRIAKSDAFGLSTGIDNTFEPRNPITSARCCLPNRSRISQHSPTEASGPTDSMVWPTDSSTWPRQRHGCPRPGATIACQRASSALSEASGHLARSGELRLSGIRPPSARSKKPRSISRQLSANPKINGAQLCLDYSNHPLAFLRPPELRALAAGWADAQLLPSTDRFPLPERVNVLWSFAKADPGPRAPRLSTAADPSSFATENSRRDCQRQFDHFMLDCMKVKVSFCGKLLSQ